MRQLSQFRSAFSSVTSALPWLTNVTARSPPILARSQKRARPSSCAARIIVGADDGVVQDVVPDDDALFGAKSADPTIDSDSASTRQ